MNKFRATSKVNIHNTQDRGKNSNCKFVLETRALPESDQ